MSEPTDDELVGSSLSTTTDKLASMKRHASSIRNFLNSIERNSKSSSSNRRAQTKNTYKEVLTCGKHADAVRILATAPSSIDNIVYYGGLFSRDSCANNDLD